MLTLAALPRELRRTRLLVHVSGPQIAELLARGVVEGSFDPAAQYRAAPEASPPALDQLILVAPEADATALAAAAVGDAPSAVSLASTRRRYSASRTSSGPGAFRAAGARFGAGAAAGDGARNRTTAQPHRVPLRIPAAAVTP
mgnify:CR=1 FL=1